MPVSTEKLCTEDQFNTTSNRIFGSVVNQDLVTLCIDLASKAVRDYCRRDFKKLQRTEFFSTIRQAGSHPFSFWINEPPIDTGQTFELKASNSMDWNDATAFTALDNDGVGDYILNEDRGKVTVFWASMAVPHSVRILYTGGYDVNGQDPDLLDVPSDVSGATAIQAAFLSQRLLSQETGQVAEAADNSSPLNLEKLGLFNLVPEARGLLKTYRKLLLGQNERYRDERVSHHRFWFNT